MAKAAFKHTINHTPSARRDLKKLKKNHLVLESVVESIKKLADNPRPSGAEALEGDVTYRIRDGEYRIIYEIDDKAKTVTITRVRDRKDVYKH